MTRIHDPTCGNFVELEHCWVLPAKMGYAPVLSVRTGEWFALHEATLTTCQMDQVGPLSLILSGDADKAVSEVLADPLDLGALCEHGDGGGVNATPASHPLHEVGGDPKHKLKAVFILGGGGSGKSLVRKAMFHGKLHSIDQDTHLEKFLKDEEVPLDKVTSRPDLLKKAQRYRKREFSIFATRRRGLTVDITGWDPQRVIAPVNRLHALGYDVMGIIVSTTAETAMRRNKARGRQLPAHEIIPKVNAVHKFAGLYQRLFGKNSFHIFSNDRDLDTKAWQSIVVPKVQAIANEFLARPIKNKRGQDWLKKLAAGETTSPEPHRDEPPPKPLRVVMPAGMGKR